MKRSLKEWTKEDWDTHFPIKLVDHDPKWAQIYASEKQKIIEHVGGWFFNSIEHFGSSSIPNIKSKPYIDILIEVPNQYLFDPTLIKNFEHIGYTCMTEPSSEHKDNYMILVKGYHLDGTSEQIFHVHACAEGHAMLDQIKFRNHLRKNSGRAKAYEKLKLELAAQLQGDRSGYRIAKTDFIQETLKMCDE